MLDVEVVGEAVLELVEHPAAASVGEHLVGDDHVHRQHREPGGDGPRVQVVRADHARGVEDVLAHGDQVDPARCRLEQDVDGLAQERPGARQDHEGDRDGRHGVGLQPSRGQDDERRHDDGRGAEQVAQHSGVAE